MKGWSGFKHPVVALGVDGGEPVDELLGTSALGLEPLHEPNLKKVVGLLAGLAASQKLLSEQRHRGRRCWSLSLPPYPACRGATKFLNLL